MLISATIPKEQRFGVILVPRSAIAEDEKGSSVSRSRTEKRCKSRFASASRPTRRPEVVSDKVTAEQK